MPHVFDEVVDLACRRSSDAWHPVDAHLRQHRNAHQSRAIRGAEMYRQSCGLRNTRDNARKDGCSCNLQTRQGGSELRIPLDKAGQLPCMNVGRILLPELWQQARSVGCMREMRECSSYESVSCLPLALFS